MECAAERDGPVLDNHRAARQVHAAHVAPALGSVGGQDRALHGLVGEDLIRVQRDAERDHVQRVAYAVRLLAREIDVDHGASAPRQQQRRIGSERTVVAGQLVDHRAAGIDGPRRGRVAREGGAEDALRKRIAVLVAGGDVDVDRAALACLQAVDDGDSATEYDGEILKGAVRPIRDGALQSTRAEMQVTLDLRRIGRRFRTEAAHHAEADLEVAQVRGGAAEQHVERLLRPGVLALADGVGQQCAARDADRERAPAGRVDADVDLADAPAAALRRTHDADLVDDDVAALERCAQAVGADGEDDDQRRDGDPRPLALVKPAQHDVVDGADQRNVGHEQHEQLLDGRQRHLRHVLHRVDDLRVVGQLQRVERLAGHRRQQPMPQGRCRRAVSEPALGRVEADEAHHAAAV